jgi:phenylpropionate dioxygenase-like ring-hydroxylating dioxygenase large terminal subunit
MLQIDKIRWDTESADYLALVDDWHVVARSQDLAEGQVMTAKLLGVELVLWRSNGQVMAWKDYCIHRGARLSEGWVRDDKLICSYHGWEYDCDAKCTKIPAHPKQHPPLKARAFPHRATERYGFIWASIGEPLQDVPPFREWEDAEFRKFYAGPYPFKANALRAVENFLDVTHFPWVHANLNGNPQDPDEIEDYEVDARPDGLHTSEIKVFQPYGDHRGVPVNAGYTFHCSRPGTAYFSKRTGETERFCTLLTTTPIEEDDCIVWLIVAINFGPELTQERIDYRQDQVFAQDRRQVEAQRPYRLPLDLKEELHIRSDKFQVEYRKWVKKLGDDAAARRRKVTSIKERARL